MREGTGGGGGGESSGVGSDPVSQRCSHVVAVILNHDFIALANGLAEQKLLSSVNFPQQLAQHLV